MKIVFVSGFLNNHILPMCDALNQNAEFLFIATEKREDAQTNESNRNTIHREFVCYYYDEQQKARAQDAVRSCDVAIFGGRSDELLAIRKQENKLCFVYTERLFRKGSWRRFIPSTRKVYSKRFIENNSRMYVLAAGAFVSKDLKLLGFPQNRCFKFGYYPVLIPQNMEDGTQGKQAEGSDCLRLLYVGRLLKLKRIDDIIQCCLRLGKSGISYHLTIIGNGPERNKLMDMAGNTSAISFAGAKKSEEIFRYMKSSDALLFPSNRQEGWGAVVNEAMSCGCPVIMSDACGSAEFLIENGKNGVVFPVGDRKKLYEAILRMRDRSFRNMLGENARRTIENEWNADVAMVRFLKVADALLHGEKAQELYASGPMSKC